MYHQENGAIFFVNASAAKLFNINNYEGLKIWDAIRFTETNDALIQFFLDAVTQDKDISSLAKYEANDGKIFHLHVNMTYMNDGGGIFVIAVRT